MLLDVEKDYPCLCLCLGLEQITITRPRLRISRHFSQILRTEARIFMFVVLQFGIDMINHITSRFPRNKGSLIHEPKYSLSLSDVQEVIQSFEDLLRSR